MLAAHTKVIAERLEAGVLGFHSAQHDKVRAGVVVVGELESLDLGFEAGDLFSLCSQQAGSRVGRQPLDLILEAGVFFSQGTALVA